MKTLQQNPKKEFKGIFLSKKILFIKNLSGKKQIGLGYMEYRLKLEKFRWEFCQIDFVKMLNLDKSTASRLLNDMIAKECAHHTRTEYKGTNGEIEVKYYLITKKDYEKYLEILNHLGYETGKNKSSNGKRKSLPPSQIENGAAQASIEQSAISATPSHLKLRTAPSQIENGAAQASIEQNEKNCQKAHETENLPPSQIEMYNKEEKRIDKKEANSKEENLKPMNTLIHTESVIEAPISHQKYDTEKAAKEILEVTKAENHPATSIKNTKDIVKQASILSDYEIKQRSNKLSGEEFDKLFDSIFKK